MTIYRINLLTESGESKGIQYDTNYQKAVNLLKDFNANAVPEDCILKTVLTVSKKGILNYLNNWAAGSY